MIGERGDGLLLEESFDDCFVRVFVVSFPSSSFDGCFVILLSSFFAEEGG